MIALPKVFWPLVVGATNNAIPVRYSGVTYTASIAVGTYYSAETFRAAVQAALVAAVGALGFSVSIGLAFPGSLTFFGSAAFAFWFGTVPTNSAYLLLGFNASDHSSSGNQIVGDYQPPNQWWAPVAAGSDLPGKSREGDRITVAMGGASKRVVETELTTRRVGFAFIDAARTHKANESGSRINASAERWWADGPARFRYWPDASVEGTFGDFILSQGSIVKWEPERMFSGIALYRFEFEFGGFV